MTCSLRLTVSWALALSSVALADDWHQWRGPERNGVVAKSVPLVDGFPKSGPKRLWTSDKLLSGTGGGWGSVSVANGRAFVYSNWKYQTPTDTRTLGRRQAGSLGWSSAKVPDEVVKLIETARCGQERAAIKPKQVSKWARQWAEKHLTGPNKRFRWVAISRLQAGPGMIPLALLTKLGSLVDKRFENEKAMVDRLRELGFGKEDTAKVLAKVPKQLDHAKDAVLCLDADTGKTLWQYEVDGKAYAWPCSSTPCIVDGRCYVQGSDGYVFCLDVQTGKQVWRVLSKARRNAGTASSFVIEQGVAVLLAGPLTGIDPATGKTLWTQPRVRGDYASAAYYRTGGKTYLVCNGAKQTFCIDPTNGRVLWQVPGGGWATPAVAGDVMVVLTNNAKTGMVAHKLTLTQPKKMWAVPFADRGASVVVHGGAVYAFAGRGKAKAMCVDLATGKVYWEQKLPNTEFSSPIVADGKIISVVGQSLFMWAPSPDQYKVLGQAAVGAETCTSPALVDGRLYLRLRHHVAAYDLRRASP